jgi:N-acetyltransferase 10
MDDELNILPTSSHVKDIHPIQRNPDGTPAIPAPKAAAELKELVASLQDTMVRCLQSPWIFISIYEGFL